MKKISVFILALIVVLAFAAPSVQSSTWGTDLHVQGRTAFGNGTTQDYDWLGMQVDQTYSGSSTYRGERVYLHQTVSNPNALIAFDAACYWQGNPMQLLHDCRGGDFSAIKSGAGPAEHLTGVNINIAVEASGQVGSAQLLQAYNLAFPTAGTHVTIDKAVGALIGLTKAGPGKDTATVQTGIGLEITTVEGNQTWGLKQDDPRNPNEFAGQVYADQGVILSTAGIQPACTPALRGTLWFLAGAAGKKDTVQVCAKDARDSYAWRALY